MEKYTYILPESIPRMEISDAAVLAKIPLVSVHMITYNHEPYIVNAIEGVIKQETNFPFEVLIGEDCSTDSTRRIVLNFQKKYPDIIRVITSDENVGAKKNTIRTFKACRGEYIATCEGDDNWHSPYKLQKQVDYLSSHRSCGLVYSSYDVFHVKSNRRITDIFKYRKWQMPDNPTILSFIENKDGWTSRILPCTVMFRRTLLEQIVESDPYLHQSEDFLLADTQIWAEIINMAPVHYIPESLATYNYTEESFTRSKGIKKRLQIHISAAELMLYLCDKYKSPKYIKNNYEASFCDASLRLAFYSRNSILAEHIRQRKNRFKVNDWLRYFGAKYSLFHYPIVIVSEIVNLLKKERNLMER